MLFNADFLPFSPFFSPSVLFPFFFLHISSLNFDDSVSIDSFFIYGFNLRTSTLFIYILVWRLIIVLV